MDEERCLAALEKTLTEKINPRRYSLGKQKEGSVCLERAGDAWTVYVADRGQKADAYVYEDADAACREIIRRLALSDEMLDELTTQYTKSK